VDAVLSQLQEERSRVRKLEDLSVFLPVPSQPDVPFVIDGDAVVAVRPVVPFARTAPGLDKIPGSIVDQDWWSDFTARPDRVRSAHTTRAGLGLVVHRLAGLYVGSFEIGLNRPGPVDGPHVIL